MTVSNMNKLEPFVIERVKRGMRLRQISAVIISLLFFIYQYSGMGSELSLNQYFRIIIFMAFVLGVNKVFEYYILKGHDNNIFKFISITLDMLLLMYIVHLTGGIESLFPLILFLNVIGVNAFLGFRWSLYTFLCGLLFYTTIVYMEYAGTLQHFPQSYLINAVENYKQPWIIALVITIIFTALLLAMLSNRFLYFRLHQREEELKKTMDELVIKHKQIKASNDELFNLNSQIEHQKELLMRANNVQTMLFNIVSNMVEEINISDLINKLFSEVEKFIPINSIALLAKKNRDKEPQLLCSAPLQLTLSQGLVSIFDEIIKNKSPVKTNELITIPVRIEHENKLILFIFKDTSSRPLNDEEISLFNSIAKQLKIYIERSELHEELKSLSNTDGLTGLYNHRYFHIRLEEELRKSKKTNLPLSLLIVDMDNFKEVNDNYGHQVGDEVLSRIGESLKESVRNSDIIARYGGDEFAVILPSADFNTAHKIGERILDSIKVKEIKVVDRSMSLSACIGFVVTNNSIPFSTRELIHSADNILYSAKRTSPGTIIGKNL